MRALEKLDTAPLFPLSCHIPSYSPTPPTAITQQRGTGRNNSQGSSNFQPGREDCILNGLPPSSPVLTEWIQQDAQGCLPQAALYFQVYQLTRLHVHYPSVLSGISVLSPWSSPTFSGSPFTLFYKTLGPQDGYPFPSHSSRGYLFITLHLLTPQSLEWVKHFYFLNSVWLYSFSHCPCKPILSTCSYLRLGKIQDL